MIALGRSIYAFFQISWVFTGEHKKVRGKVGQRSSFSAAPGVTAFKGDSIQGFSCGIMEEIVLFAIDQLYCELTAENPFVKFESEKE